MILNTLVYIPCHFDKVDTTGLLSVPVVDDRGMVFQCFCFDLRMYDKEKYKILQAVPLVKLLDFFNKTK